MVNEVNVSPNMITWAIGRAGYDLDEFIATKYPKVQDWLDDKKKPTVRQLEEFSHKVHLPFGYLFLQEPPVEKLPIPFFRTGKAPAEKVSLNVYDTILLLQKRQEWVAEYLKDAGFAPLGFVGKYDAQSNPLEIVADMRQTLGLEENWASRFPNWEQAKAHLAGCIEETGVIISFNSVVENNNHRKIEVEECRGFVLVDKMAPFMFVNAGDGKAAQMFTLAHELAHIWTGQSAGFDFRQMLPANDPIELLCDKVAAEFLAPAAAFNREWEKKADIQAIARRFKVSPIVAGRRALDLGKIGKGQFFKFYNDYVKKIRLQKKSQSGGGDFYATQKSRLSLRFMAHLNQALKEDKILYRDAYKLTGLRGDTFQNFAKQIL